MSSPPSDHRWFEQHLVKAAAGLLPPEQYDALKTHRDQCDACREAWTEYQDRSEAYGDDASHLPSAMISRWPQAQKALRGAERTAVLWHLKRCDTCREELAVLGHDVDLSSLEDALPRSLARPKPGRPFLRGAVVGAMAGAVAASLILMTRPAATPPDSPGGLLPWTAPVELRAGSGTVLVVPPQARSIGLTVGTPRSFALDQSAQIEVLDPTGVSLLQITVPPEELERGTVLLLVNRSEPLLPGRYEVRMTQPSVPDPERRFFEIRRP